MGSRFLNIIYSFFYLIKDIVDAVQKVCDIRIRYRIYKCRMIGSDLPNNVSRICKIFK